MTTSNILSEVHTVEETKHLVPNLESFSKAVFREDSFLLDWRKNQMDWITDKVKKFDGIVWLPWKSEVWLTEVEWKKDSNFFDQARTFSKSKIDKTKLEDILKTCLQKIEQNLSKFFPHAVRGDVVISEIVKKTLEDNFDHEGHFRPHTWVLLGHEGPNIEDLRNLYVDEVSARSRGKHYIVTTARMFINAFSTYFLLEHSCSNNDILPKILVRCPNLIEGGGIKTEGLSAPAVLTTPKEDRPLVPVNIKPEPPKGSRAEKIFTLLSNSSPETNIGNLRLKFTLPDVPEKYFKIDWSHKGEEFLIIGEDFISNKPANVLKASFGDRIPPKMPNACQNYGQFYDISITPPKFIVSYADVANAISKKLSKIPIGKTLSPRKTTSFFEEKDVHKESKVKFIVKKRKLWEVFLAKRKMSKTEFIELGPFKAHGVATFIRFLTVNGIATKRFDDYILDEREIPHIRRILDEYSEAT